MTHLHRSPWHRRVHPYVWRELRLSAVLMTLSVFVFWVFAHLVAGTAGWVEWVMLYALAVVVICAFFKGATDGDA